MWGAHTPSPTTPSAAATCFLKYKTSLQKFGWWNNRAVSIEPSRSKRAASRGHGFPYAPPSVVEYWGREYPRSARINILEEVSE